MATAMCECMELGTQTGKDGKDGKEGKGQRCLKQYRANASGDRSVHNISDPRGTVMDGVRPQQKGGGSKSVTYDSGALDGTAPPPLRAAICKSRESSAV